MVTDAGPLPVVAWTDLCIICDWPEIDHGGLGWPCCNDEIAAADAPTIGDDHALTRSGLAPRAVGNLEPIRCETVESNQDGLVGLVREIQRGIAVNHAPGDPGKDETGQQRCSQPRRPCHLLKPDDA